MSGRALELIIGVEERDSGTQLTPEEYHVENWQVEHYQGLYRNRVSLIDVEHSRTWDLCELGKMLDIRKKGR